MQITLIEPLDGSSMRKRKMRCADGSIISLPEDHLVRGRAHLISVPLASSLATALDAMTIQAITLGVPRHGPGPWWLVTKDALPAYSDRPDVIARTKDWFGWPGAPGWLLIDLDDPGAWMAGRELEALQYIWPELAEASLVIRPSSSAGIVPGKGGLHIFVLVADLNQAKRILEELDRRATYLGAPGLIDTVVGSPERIVYVAPPILLGGLTRQVQPTYWKEGCAIGMTNICEPEREIVPALPATALGELADPANWPADLHEAVEGYLLSVVHGLCRDIAVAPKGRRSTRLFSAGARLGNYAWTESRALAGAGSLLLEAARGCNYFDDYGEHIAQAHLARGWEQGCAKPEIGLPALARWQRKDEILAQGAALARRLQERNTQ
jgi:hypothetical protein